jgi:hypothetical protein
MNQDQYLEYIKSTDFTDKYLSALKGTQEEKVNNFIQNNINTTYSMSNEGITQFAIDRGYDQLFTTQVTRKTNNNIKGNNIELSTANEYENPIKEMLYSQKNINFLQQKCIEAIYYKTNKRYLISPQDENQILQIITNVYNNIPIQDYYVTQDNILFKQEISYLNSFILKEMIEYVYNSLLNYISYSEFIANGIQPIERPVNVSIKGTNTLLY